MGRVIRVFALLLALGACATGFVDFPVTEEDQQELPDNINIVRLNEANIGQFSRAYKPHSHTNLPARHGWDYKVGIGDLLLVIFFDHPELNIPAGADGQPAGFRVRSDGTIHYPFIGEVQASGRAPETIRADMAQRLAEFFPSPQVEVRVSAFNSQSISVSGEVKQPNRQVLTSTSLNLIEAINVAGGMTEAANGSHVHVKRGGKVYDVDLNAFLRGAADGNNPVMRNGDVVFVNRRETQEAYMMGEVGRVDVVDLAKDSVTLTQALARQGGLDGRRADARGIFVFRNRANGMFVYQLDITSPAGLLLGTRFLLAPDDVVYVVRSPLARWNDIIEGLIPSLGAVRTTQAITE